MSRLTCAAMLLCATSGIAHAQSMVNSDRDDLQIKEIIVTAEKRSTELQKTPSVVNVVSGEAIQDAGISKIEDLQRLVPNLTMTKIGGRTDYAIRGVSAQILASTDQASTAVIVDGVYTQSTTAGLGSFMDVRQVEVLKGPQGTLFGRNSTAGVISISTNDPVFENAMAFNINVGNYHRVGADATVNLALSDQLALRVSGGSSVHDGYFKDGYDDENIKSARAKLLFRPSEDLSLLLTGNYGHQGGRGGGYILLNRFTGAPYASDPWAGPTDPAYQAVLPAFRGYWGQPGQFDQETYGFTGTVKWSIGPGELTVLGAYNHSVRGDVQQNFQFTNSPNKETSAEVRYASRDNDGPITWMVGGYYYDGKLSLTNYGGISAIRAGFTPPFGSTAVTDVNVAAFTNLLGGNAVTFNGNLNQQTKDYAFFTQETLKLTDALRLTVGARWQKETISRAPGARTINYRNGVVFTDSTTTVGLKKSWEPITWRASLDYSPTPTSLIYASVSRGWKAGKANPHLAPYDEQLPETLTAYTIGTKNRFFDRRLLLNAEIFYWDYRDRQVLVSRNPVFNLDGTQVFGPGGSPNFLVPTNAPKSHIQGADFEASFRITQNDQISAYVEYLDEARFDDLGGQLLNSCPASKDCQANNAPRWSGTIGYRHSQEIGQAGRLTFDYTGKFQSRVLLDLNGVPGEEAAYMQKAYYMSNVGVSFEPHNSNINVRFYMNNVENKLIKVLTTREVGGGQTFYRGYYLAPRTFGVQLRGAF